MGISWSLMNASQTLHAPARAQFCQHWPGLACLHLCRQGRGPMPRTRSSLGFLCRTRSPAHWPHFPEGRSPFLVCSLDGSPPRTRHGGSAAGSGACNGGQHAEGEHKGLPAAEGWLALLSGELAWQEEGKYFQWKVGGAKQAKESETTNKLTSSRTKAFPSALKITSKPNEKGQPGHRERWQETPACCQPPQRRTEMLSQLLSDSSWRSGNIFSDMSLMGACLGAQPSFAVSSLDCQG